MIIILAAVVVIGAIVGIVLLKGEKGYRLIQVYEVNGTATLQRESVGSMDAYENLNLLSGDLVNVLMSSFLRLKMDSDKYMLVEEDSCISIYATGKDKNSKTNIQLEKGAVTVEVQNQLQDGESFEVTTPNAVMAIRGTVFRITVGVDKNGRPVTKFTVLEGSVTICRKDENGNLSEPEVLSSGKEAIVATIDDEITIIMSEGIDMDGISDAALEFLDDVAENGRELYFPQERIKEEILRRKNKQADSENTSEEDVSDVNDEDNTENTQDTDNVESQNNPNEDNTSQETNENENGDSSENIDDSEEENSDESEENNKDDNAEEENTSEEDNSEEENTSEEDNSEEENTSEEENNSDEENQPQEKKLYTVTFMYEGQIFGTQQVEEGQKAMKPTLLPAPYGEWDFDFNSVITADTIINFVTVEE